MGEMPFFSKCSNASASVVYVTICAFVKRQYWSCIELLRANDL